MKFKNNLCILQRSDFQLARNKTLMPFIRFINSTVLHLQHAQSGVRRDIIRLRGEAESQH